MKKRERTAQMSIYQEEDVFALLQEMRDLLRRAYAFREEPQWVDISVTETEMLINEISAIIEFLDAHKMTPKTSMKKEKTMARINRMKKRADKNELLSDLVDLLNECAADVQAEIDYYNNKIGAMVEALNGEMDDEDYAELLDLIERVRYYDFEDTPGGIADEIERYFL